MSLLAAILYLLPLPFLIYSEDLYDRHQDFTFNCSKNYPFPAYQRMPLSIQTDLFGYPLASPIGIPACAMMTSNGIAWASKAGYDVLTYKTVRSVPCEGHPLPNILFLQKDFVSCDTMISLPIDSPLPSDGITMANTMGIPSLSLAWVLEDIREARKSLGSGQILIVSILGSDSKERTLLQDFAFLARAVSDAGAQVIEANLSCPNLHTSQPSYKDPAMVSSITQAICEAVPHLPVIVKVGLFDSIEQMTEVLLAAANAKAKGICGINTIPMKIVDPLGNPSFGKDSLIAGVSGDSIRTKAYEFTIQARRIIIEHHLNLVLLATGGILKPEHFQLFLEAGADIALSATGAMWIPNLAVEFHQFYSK